MKINKYMEYKCENGRLSEMNYLKGFSILTIVLMHLLAIYILNTIISNDTIT